MENVSSASEDEEDDASPSTQDVEGLGPSEESSADVFDAALPPLRALTRGGAHRTGRIGDAMRAWGRDAAFDARACIRRACLASLRAADATVLGVQSVDMDGSNYSANSISTEKATYKAMETLPAEVFAAVIRAATHALAKHFARAEIVRSAAQYALGTVAKDGGKNTSAFGTVADDVRTQLCASLPPGERASASAAASDAVLALADASQGADGEDFGGAGVDERSADASRIFQNLRRRRVVPRAGRVPERWPAVPVLARGAQHAVQGFHVGETRGVRGEARECVGV
jgi:hypothetical protein